MRDVILTSYFLYQQLFLFYFLHFDTFIDSLSL